LDGGNSEEYSNEITKKEVVQEYTKKGIEKLTSKERLLLSNEERRNIKVQKLITENKLKIKALKDKGYDKRRIYKNINLSRVSKTYPESIEEISNFLDEYFQ